MSKSACLRKWWTLKVLKLHLQVGPNIVLAIAANKQDLRKDQAVSDNELAVYAASIGALHAGTSAKTGEGLTEIFQALADRVAAQHRSQQCLQGVLVTLF